MTIILILYHGHTIGIPSYLLLRYVASHGATILWYLP